jgi:sarcosine oxidase subunit alpha
MRVDGKGRIDRDRPVRFSFDGHAHTGFAGDTLASALLADGVRVMGRSFKYHRPRGVMTAGSEEPNALVTLGTGTAQVPNCRATTVELQDGLAARSQNRWPSLGLDLLAVNDLLWPFLGAGFYYKTFMWPRAFWEKVYEPAIRRAAGLGALSGEAAEDGYERAFAHCDLLVIGAGPAGLMAALTAAQAGADVILAEEDVAPGGRLLTETEEVDGRDGGDWAAETAARLAAMPNVRIMTRTAVTGAYDGGAYGALERLAPETARRKDAPAGCFWRIATKRAILASGALERPVAFPMNDRPGVMMAGAVRAYLNRWGVAAGRNVVVFGNNDGAHRTVADLQAAGVHVVALVDARPHASCAHDVAFYPGAQVTGTSGRRGVDAVRIATQGGTERIAADVLAVSGGWNPTVHLACHMGGRPVWDEARAAFLAPEGAVPGMTVAGAAAGQFSTHCCLESGISAGQAAAAELGLAARGLTAPRASDGAYDIAPLWHVAGRGRAWLDFQNDVTVKDVQLAVRENFRSVEHMKRYTTQGMAPDQGKNSNVAALAVLADATGRTIPETGTTTFRPPYVPVPLAAMGAGGSGRSFAPERLTTSHAGIRARGAPTVEAGLWHRPSYFPRDGETHWRQSCDREVAMVRGAVGVCDVSTLGKIDVQGPDAAAFVDLIYTNAMSKLAPGRVRYGLMLREDGHVMDDGTCARLSDTHFLMSTTTAAAGAVMRHVDFASQVLRPSWDVRAVSVTEHWAQFAVAGPKSVELLGGILDAPPDLPFMGVGPTSVGGVPARLFRISFSGEKGYEIAVPARYGAALFEALVSQAEALGGGAYGMEALNVLRLEKGFITHAEIHGRVTAFDVGMQGLMSRKKDFIGKAAATRPGLLDESREQLVGLTALEGEIRPGAHLFDEGDAAVAANDRGYVTSSVQSPTLGHGIALGFLANGRARIGARVRAVDHLRGAEVLCEVCAPGWVDPEGGRMRD